MEALNPDCWVLRRVQQGSENMPRRVFRGLAACRVSRGSVGLSGSCLGSQVFRGSLNVQIAGPSGLCVGSESFKAFKALLSGLAACRVHALRI